MKGEQLNREEPAHHHCDNNIPLLPTASSIQTPHTHRLAIVYCCCLHRIPVGEKIKNYISLRGEQFN